jgi:hypothetical protein
MSAAVHYVRAGARGAEWLNRTGATMTENQWLLFVGVPAFVAVILLIADYMAARRRRIETMISTTLLDEKSEPASAEGPQDVKPIRSQPSAGHPDAVAELERLINAKRRN